MSARVRIYCLALFVPFSSAWHSSESKGLVSLRGLIDLCPSTMRCAQSCYEEVGGDGMALAGNATVSFSGLRLELRQCGAKSLGIKQIFEFHLRPISLYLNQNRTNIWMQRTWQLEIFMWYIIPCIYTSCINDYIYIYIDPSMHLCLWAMRRNIACTNCWSPLTNVVFSRQKTPTGPGGKYRKRRNA